MKYRILRKEVKEVDRYFFMPQIKRWYGWSRLGHGVYAHLYEAEEAIAQYKRKREGRSVWKVYEEGEI